MGVDKSSFITIDKVQVVQRQLRTALVLFFNHGDTVSIHTLVAAAHGILRDVAVKTNAPNIEIDWDGTRLPVKGSVLKDLPIIRKDRKREYIKAVNSAQNFFKHADRDHKESLNFSSFQTEALLLDCAHIYPQIRGVQLRELHIYNTWFILA